MNVQVYTFKKIFKVGPIRVKKVPTEYLQFIKDHISFDVFDPEWRE